MFASFALENQLTKNDGCHMATPSGFLQMRQLVKQLTREERNSSGCRRRLRDFEQSKLRPAKEPLGCGSGCL